MDNGITYFVHRIDPVIVRLFGVLPLRWYGMAYLLAFLTTGLLLAVLSRRGRCRLPINEVYNFIVFTGVFGVLLGGRLGYLLFYIPGTFLREPWIFVKVWEGGMSSHGGMLGVLLAVLFYARKHHYPFWDLMDNMATVVPVGIGFGRLANFINGELWGRVTTVPWAVIFPGEAGISHSQADPARIRSAIQSGLLHPRHPSQLYEAFGEGFLLFALLWLLRKTKWSRVDGRISAIFLLFYGLFRIAVEFFREPDRPEWVYFGWMTRGQIYSIIMVIAGLALLWLPVFRNISASFAQKRA